MALRLTRYVATIHREDGPVSFARASRSYVEHGGYVDWARRYILGGDETAELAEAFGNLAERLREVRERLNKPFASLLAAWNKVAMVTDEVVPIEQALSQFVAKLARSTALLLLVIDGMSYAVFRELSDDLRDHGWLELTDCPGQCMPALVSTIPSVTEMSRASLFSGTLTHGNSAAEKQNFASHADLTMASRATYRPVLFHKGELTEASSTEISDALRQAIRQRHQRVVAVVLNAVDDHLAKSDQLRLSWMIGQFQHLDALLYEAQLAHRAVIVTSDHGHVLDEGVSRLAVGEGERWRMVSGALAEGEAVFEGARVERVTGSSRIIAPWSETPRYAPKKHGYHGGATPQEVLVPVGIFTRSEDVMQGWTPAPAWKPAWWSEGARQPIAILATAPRQLHRRGKTAGPQASLFTELETNRHEDSPAGWIDHLLSSPIFAAQRRMVGRRAPDNGMVEGFLRVLDQHHDRLSPQALAQALGQSEYRMQSILVVLQRLLIVDGYQVVTMDETTGTIALSRPLLAEQFQLPSSLQ